MGTTLEELQLHLECTVYHFSFDKNDRGDAQMLDLSTVRLLSKKPTISVYDWQITYYVCSSEGLQEIEKTLLENAKTLLENAPHEEEASHEEDEEVEKENVLNTFASKLAHYIGSLSCGEFVLEDERSMKVDSILFEKTKRPSCAAFGESAWNFKRASAFLSTAFYLAHAKGVNVISLEDAASVYPSRHHYSTEATFSLRKPFYGKFQFDYKDLAEMDGNQMNDRRNKIMRKYETSQKNTEDWLSALSEWEKYLGRVQWNAELDMSRYKNYEEWMKRCEDDGAWMPKPLSHSDTVVKVVSVTDMAPHNNSLMSRKRKSVNSGHSGGMPSLHLLSVHALL